MIRTSLLNAWRDHLFRGGAVPTLIPILRAPQFFFAKFRKKYARIIRVYTVYVSYITTAIIPITYNVCRDYHQWIFLYGKDSVSGLCNRPSPLWDFCPWSSSLMKHDHDGIINLHNHHLWATDNPQGMVVASHQQQLSINVWAGIIGDHLFGPVLLPQHLKGETYLAFLQNTLPPLLQNVSLAIWHTMWLRHIGAPAHFLINACRHLNNIFPRCRIGHWGTVAWPARSPDLNPLDFYLWGQLISIVYG